MPTSPVTLAVLGAGMRASGFCENVRYLPHRARIVAVAEPNDTRRERFAERHEIPESGRFASWQELLDRPRIADAVLVATMDRDHVGPAIVAMEAGYHLLLEKPMAPELDQIVTINQAYLDANAKHGVLAGVVHPLRYGPSYAALKRLVDAGRLGVLMTLDHMEGVGWWHQAHSFVRGNWSRAAQSTFMLLAKSCHDVDYVCHLVGRPVERVSSFGSLGFFREERAPPGSTDRCLDCPVEPDCAYSAVRWYLATERDRWPAAAAGDDHSAAAREATLRTGPYGRCVWRAGNDVVDHQVVAVEFEGGVTATVTMTAFTQRVARRSRVHGSTAELAFDEDSITIRDFDGNHVTTQSFGNTSGGHAGADRHILDGFVRAVERGDQRAITTTIPESMTTHAVTFAAEAARLGKRVIEIGAFLAEHDLTPTWPGTGKPPSPSSSTMKGAHP